MSFGQMLSPGSLPVTFGQDPAGEIYVAEYSSGKIFKLAGLGQLEWLAFLPEVGR